MRKLISKKKPTYRVSKKLSDYLTRIGRNIKIPLYYDDLLRFQGVVSIYDEKGNDTLWVSAYYSEFDREEIDHSLKRMYTILHADGSDAVLRYLSIDSIDYCTFGNSKPFRIKVRNILNEANSEAGKIGRKSLEKSNRFVIMVNAGSKGSEINISQMISCLGQQVVDSKRIPY